MSDRYFILFCGIFISDLYWLKATIFSFMSNLSNKMIEEINPEQTAIAWCFGYGSLVESYHNKAKYVEVNINYRRVWNAWNTKARATFLGLEKTIEKHAVNGVIYPIYSQKEIEDLDLREQGYSRLAIPHEDVKVLNEGLNETMQDMKLDSSMLLFTYVPNCDGNAPEAWFPILQSYVDLCANGFLRFRKEEQPRDASDPVRRFLDTTHKWSKYMLNDRVLARRPWVSEKNQFVIDDYLDDEDDVNDIPAALYPTDFSVRFFREIQEGLMTCGTDRKRYVSDNSTCR
uniref:Gamma-glutamylcyclotransferase n=2 Tax=Clytia hemisphaerica TaxID=252671 RepID=A0A7M5XE70_9CNID